MANEIRDLSFLRLKSFYSKPYDSLDHAEYIVIGTPYVIVSFQGKLHYWKLIYNKYGMANGSGKVNLSDILSDAPDNIKEEIIFNLDLFGR